MSAPVVTATCTEDAVIATVDIDAPPDVVWAALTDGAQLAAWWGSDDMYRTHDWTVELRPGGRWRALATAAAGGPAMEVGGEFLEVTPPSRLAMTWNPSWEPVKNTRILYELSPQGDGTRLLLTHTGFAGHAQSRDGHAVGWQRVIGWLVAFLTHR
jgi:uncharacterized protein YndB with AHSA1/START domain